MTPYVQNIIDDWERQANAAGRRRLLCTEENKLPDKTVKRIVDCFGFPEGLREYCFQFGEAFNLPEVISKDDFLGVQPPDVEGEIIFHKEFDLTQTLMKTFDILLEKKPIKQEIERHHKKIKKALSKNLSEIEAVLKISDRHKKAILLSGFGGGILWLDHNLQAIIKSLDMSFESIESYSAYGSATQVRDGAILSLAYSYYYCFGEMPKTTTNSAFFMYVDKLLAVSESDIPSETITSLIKAAISKFKEQIEAGENFHKNAETL